MYDLQVMSYSFSIYDWMLDYDLTRTEILILAFCNSFSFKLDCSKYLHKSNICYCLKISSRQFDRSIKKLIDLQLIQKLKISKSVIFVLKNKIKFIQNNEIWKISNS